ncbi:MAG: prolyl oligopeptidase family serine peptidase, partial [Methylococcaceae bacterium]|nr:prolyl oligopeptidase family serine peptidase [Methylococcaceae bacterium]
MNRQRFLAALVISAVFSVSRAGEVNPLAGYAADITQTTISGLSSGAFMTTQLHVAYSRYFSGAAIIAGGPYYCAGSYTANTFLENATTACMNPLTESVGPHTAKLIRKAKEFADAGAIDPLENLLDDRVYIFTGSADDVVKSLVVEQTLEFYKNLGLKEDNLRFDNTVDAGHAIITDNASDVPCSETKAPFINNCGFEQSNHLLKFLYPDLRSPAEKLSGRLVAFRQSEFVPDFGTARDYSSMDDSAYVYIPAACETEKCRVHIVLHGCEQGSEVIGEEYVTTTGYNEVADTNALIVLYPQIKPSQPVPFNPKGCWDFWGYSSANTYAPDFYNHDAPQMKAIIAMLERLGAAR